MQRIRRRLASEKGFTLIELLVVILIIGILAAIAIPSFLNQKGKANDANAISAARTAQTAMETYATGHNGSYDGVTVADLKGIEKTLNDTPGNTLAVSDASDTGYTVTVTAQSTGNTYSITRNENGSVTRNCTVGGSNAGECQVTGDSTSGTWGPDNTTTPPTT
jgi:type IV pilus assembly protein PilA